MSKKSEQKKKQEEENKEKIFSFFKIKDEKVKKIISIIVPILFLATGAITFTFPFIQLNTIFKVLLLIIWIISFFVFWSTYAIITAVIEEEKEIKKFIERKETYIFLFLSFIVTLFISFLLKILNKSFNANFDIFSVVYYLFFILLFIWLFIRYHYDGKRRFFKEIIVPVAIVLSLFVIFACLYPGSNYENDVMENYARVILISIGSIILFTMVIMFFYKLLFNDIDMIPGKYIWGTIFIIIVVIVGFLIIVNLPLKDETINNLITIYASVLGGGLTLLGVLMEMKHQDKTRKEEKIEQEKEKLLEYKPWFTAYSNSFIKDVDRDSVRCYIFDNYEYKNLYLINDDLFKIATDESIVYKIPNITFKNTDQSNFIIEKITVNEYESYQKNNIIRKLDNFYLYNLVIVDNDGHFPEILIHTFDILKNKYIFKVIFEEKIQEKILKNNNQLEKKTVKYSTLKVINIEEVTNDKH